MPDRIHVVSMGTGDTASLSTLARQAIAAADVIIGEPRFRSAIDDLNAQAAWKTYPKPFGDLTAMISERAGRRLVLLASGDALFYGVGSLLRRQFDPQRLVFHPNVSSLQAAVHTLAMPWQDLRVVSLHGRPLSNLRAHLAPGERLGLFTDERSHPAAIADELVAAGFARAWIRVCENLGGPEQRITGSSAAELAGSERQFHALNLCIVDLPLAATVSATLSASQSATLAASDQPQSGVDTRSMACPDAFLSTRFPGIADEHFSTGGEPGYGMISKREVRLAILSLMQPCRGEIAWDIGAGCGSVSVEWARANPGGTIHAIELDGERLRHIDINRERFGVTTNCLPINAEAPACCAELPAPHCIFIGGSTGQLETMLDFAWVQLAIGGKLVASAVTNSSQQALARFFHDRHQEGHQTDWCEMSIRKSLPASTTVRDLRPVHLLRCIRQKTA